MMGMKIGPDGAEGFADVETRRGALRVAYEWRRLDAGVFRAKVEFAAEMHGETAIVGLMSPELPDRLRAHDWVCAKIESIARM